MRFRYSLAVVVCLSLVPFPIRADEQHSHSHFGDMGQVGTVQFPTSCSVTAQPQFERAVAMLHSFWYEEAGKAFQSIAETDLNCSMAWWGVAMSLWHPLWPAPDTESLKKGQAAVAKAQSLPANTNRERDYIAAIGSFYKDYDKTDHRTRALAYEKAMQQVAQRYPNDCEASIFYSLALLATAPATDKSYANQRKAGEILEKVFVEQPNHPGVAHYIIHSYDNPVLAERALTAARSYAKIAPSVPHAQHMPSHIFVRLGLWQEAIASNLASAAAARDYEIKTHMEGVWDQRLHAMDYLVYSYLQSGQEAEARRVVEEASAMPPDTKPTGLIAGYALAAIPARFAIERQNWVGAALLGPRPNTGPAAEAITWWARAIGAAHLGDADAAQQNIAKIETMKSKLEASSDPNAKYWAGQAEIQRREAVAWLAHAQGQDSEALRLVRSAVEMEDATEKNPVTPGPVLPARELLADLLMERKQAALALTEFQSSLRYAPNRFHAIYGAAQAAEAAQQPEIAKRYYGEVVEICSHCRTDDPNLRRAQQFLAMK